MESSKTTSQQLQHPAFRTSLFYLTSNNHTQLTSVIFNASPFFCAEIRSHLFVDYVQVFIFIIIYFFTYVPLVFSWLESMSLCIIYESK